jgi:hypothetical protein
MTLTIDNCHGGSLVTIVNGQLSMYHVVPRDFQCMDCL